MAAEIYQIKESDETVLIIKEVPENVVFIATERNGIDGIDGVDANINNIGSLVNGADTATLDDTDLVMTVESSVVKKNTWTQVKSFLKTYFDTIYTTTGAVASQITTALSGYLTSATAASTYQPIGTYATGGGTATGTNTGDQDLSGLVVKANNLSDLSSASTARTNLGLGTLATQNGTFSGTSSGTNTGDQNDHGLMTGLSDDDHPIYAFLAGRAGGQTLIGGTGVTDALTLQGTSGNGTLTDKALRVLVGNNGATEVFNILNNGKINTGSEIIIGGATGNVGILSFFNSSVRIQRTPASGMQFDTGGGTKMTLLSTGELGFGTTTPTAKLDIVGPTLTSAQATSALSITQTWNTTGSPTAIFANISNTASGASANLMDLQVGGISYFKVTKAGDLQVISISNLSTIALASAGYFRFGVNTRSAISSPANGNILFQNTSLTDFNLHQYGGTTSSFPALKRSTTNIQVRLADDSAFSFIEDLYRRAGSGSPEGVVTAPIGAYYSRTDGGAGTSLYVKESGTGNTGWIAK